MHSLSPSALRRGLAIAPGNLFSVDESHPEFLRLPFLLSPVELECSVKGLIDTWRQVKSSAAVAASATTIV